VHVSLRRARFENVFDGGGGENADGDFLRDECVAYEEVGGGRGGDCEAEDGDAVGGAFGEAENSVGRGGARAQRTVELRERDFQVDDVVIGGGDAVVVEEGWLVGR